MRSDSSFYVFKKWKHAKDHAFGSQNKLSIVPEEDKQAYGAIFSELVDAAERSRIASPQEAALELKAMNFSPKFGSRGHRPVDLWISICGTDSSPLGQMPQVYAIASERGLEVGFAVSIDESDYHDSEVKARNRLAVPILNAKLPSPSDGLTNALDQILADQGGWHFNTKTRLSSGDLGFDQYHSLAEMFGALKGTAKRSGGGTVCRIFRPEQLNEVDVEIEFVLALQNFLPLIGRCAPSARDEEVISGQEAVTKLAAQVSFDPEGQEDARRMVLAEVARRQGQATFRNALMKAYDGRCAITGTTVAAVLQAAHITPYLGPETNHVTNGLLLRADLHTLFDLGLLKIQPETLTVSMSESLADTPYAEWHGKTLITTSKPSERPSLSALHRQFGTPKGHSDVSSNETSFAKNAIAQTGSERFEHQPQVRIFKER